MPDNKHHGKINQPYLEFRISDLNVTIKTLDLIASADPSGVSVGALVAKEASHLVQSILDRLVEK